MTPQHTLGADTEGNMFHRLIHADIFHMSEEGKSSSLYDKICFYTHTVAYVHESVGLCPLPFHAGTHAVL